MQAMPKVLGQTLRTMKLFEAKTDSSADATLVGTDDFLINQTIHRSRSLRTEWCGKRWFDRQEKRQTHMFFLRGKRGRIHEQH